MGHHCGYVAIPKSHPWFGKDYSDKVSVPKEVISRETNIDKIGVLNLLCADEPTEDTCEIVLAVDVHGGITYAEPEGEQWVFGFDCAHFGDALSPERVMPGEIWRDRPFAEAETRALADQLREFDPTT